MSSVDDRIVNMKFNNQQFLKGASDTQRSLDGVERAISKAGNSKGFMSMGGAVEGIGKKFSAMQVVGVTALATITNKAVNAGINLVKSLTLDPIMDGFSEYQTNLNSIQTVMANTGAGVNEVNGYMNKLNAYSDQTIYNFSEMAKNIGTFTAAGVDLKTSTAAIQGISNIAALSGSSSQQASTAMYQLSQSIAAGRVGLQDWNSVVNAGMGGKNFQTALATTAAAMGDISQGSLEVGDKVKIAGKSFRESISGGDSWLSSDTLVKTLELMDGRLSSASYQAGGLSKSLADVKVKEQQAQLASEGYTAEQIKSLTAMADSAYQSATVVKTFPQLMQVVKESIGSVFAQSFSIILGNFEQSKALWTKVGSYLIGPTGFISKMGGAWTGMLNRWATDGGRDKVVRSFGRIFSTLGKVMGAFGDAFKDVFPPDSKQLLMQITRLFTHFTKNLVIGEDTVNSLRSIFGGLFAILHIGLTVFKAIASAAMAFFGAIIGPSKDAGGGILSVVGSVGEMLKALDRFLTRGGQINDVFTAVGATAGAVIMPILKLLGLVGKAFGSLATGGGVSGFLAPFKDAKATVMEFVSTLLGGLAQITAPFGALSGYISSLKTKVDSIKDSFSGVGASATDAIGGITSGASGAVGGALGKVSTSINSVKSTADGLKQSVDSMFAGFHGQNASAAEGSTSKLAETGTQIKDRWDMVAVVMGKLGTNVRAIFQKIADVAGAVKDEFQQLFGGMDALDWANVLNSLFTGALLLNISRFVKDSGGLLQGLAGSLNGTAGAIKGSFGQLTDTLKTMQSQVKSQIVKNIAIAVALLAGSIIALSFVDPKKIAISVGAIGTMMGLLIATFKALDKLHGDKELALISLGITLISAAMVNLAVAIAILGNLDMSTLAKGIGAMAAILGVLIGAMKSFSKIQGSIAGMAASMLVISVAMNILAGAIALLGNMDTSTLAKGIGAMGISLSLLAGAMLKLDKMKGSPEGLAGAMLIMAAAMVVMSKAVERFGNMDISTLAKGIGALAIVMGMMVASISILSAGGPEALMGAGAILILAGALMVMTGVILTLGAAPWDVVAKGLLFLAAALAIVLAAGALAMIVAPGLLALGIAVGLLGIGLGAAGAGMFLFATGFAIFAAAGVAGVALLVTAFSAFMALLPTLAVQVGASVVAFLETIAKMSPRIRAAFKTIFTNILGTIQDTLPVIRDLLNKLVDTALEVIMHSVPKWVEAGFTIIDEFLKSAEAHIPDIATAAGDMIVKFIEAIDTKLQDIITAGTNLIVHFLEGLGKATKEITTAVAETILDLLEALDAAIVFYTKDFQDVGVRIAGHIADGLTFGLAGKAKGAVNSVVDNVTGNPVDEFKKKQEKAAGQKDKAQYRNAFGSPVGSTVNPVTMALILANAIIAKGNQPVGNALAAAQDKQAAAASAQATADAAAMAAAKMDKKYNKGKGNPTRNQQHKIDVAQKAADNKANAAQSAQDAADKYSGYVDDAISFRDADAQARGDMRRDQAANAATAANEAFARAQRLQTEAKDAKNESIKKKLLTASTKALAEAQQQATNATNLAKEATSHYATAIRERAAGIETDFNADMARRADEEAYDKADDAGKKAILEQRKTRDEQAAAAATTEYNRLIAYAKSVADTDTEAANTALDQAEKQAALVAQYLDAVKSDSQSLDSLTGQLSQSGAGSVLSPSRTALEDAAKAVDRYTESLAEATILAESTSQPIQFIQNNNSPKNLSPTETYRLGKNLISAYEAKMGVGN